MKEMRRKRQQLSLDVCEKILAEGTSGVLALACDDEYPYALPISYVYSNHKIYFHCAKSGHKLDIIQKNAKASFCVISKDDVKPEEYTTYFQSVIAFGKMRIVEEEAEFIQGMLLLSKKYSSQFTQEHHLQEINKVMKALCVLCLDVEEMSGKEAKELVNQKV